MIEELAIYENMLEQCQMTVSKLRHDYQNPPQPKGNSKLVGPKFYSTIAKINGDVVGYTVSIGIPCIFTCQNLRKFLFQKFKKIF